MARFPFSRGQQLTRYRQVIRVLVKYGFGELLATLGVTSSGRDEVGPQALQDQNIQDLSSAQRFRLALEELGPTFIKLGQILSTRPDLVPPEFIIELERLQDTNTPLPWSVIRDQIEAELGTKIEDVFIFVQYKALATASLAQVHAARLKDGTDVILKVQRPNIRRTIENDLEILKNFASLVNTFTILDQVYDLPDIAEDFGYILLQELDYIMEGHNADQFRRNFEGDNDVHIPKIYWDYCTPQMLVMERLMGIKINDVKRLEQAGYDRKKIAAKSARLIIKEVLEDGFFHADPHPGNLLVMHNEVIGVLDFGMVGWLDNSLRSQVARLFVAMTEQDTDTIVSRLIQLEIAPANVNRKRLNKDFGRFLYKYYGRSLENIKVTDFIADLQPIIARHHLRVPTELWLLFKTLVVMQGVGLQLDPDFDIFGSAKPYMQRLIWRQISINSAQKSIIRSSINIQDLLTTIPDLIRQVERGQLKIQIEITELETLFKKIVRVTDRIMVTILLGALILGLSLLIPSLNENTPLLFTLFVGGMFVITVILSVVLVIDTLRDI